MSILHFIKRCQVSASNCIADSIPEKVYDLQAFFGMEEESCYVIENISSNFNFVDRIAKLIEANEVSKMHLTDIVEDLLNENYSITQ